MSDAPSGWDRGLAPERADARDGRAGGRSEATREAVASVAMMRHAPNGAVTPAHDAVAREEPLEIQLGAAPLAVLMRTPGHDQELALGFLVTERVVASAADVLSIHPCSVVSQPEAEGNVVRALLREGVAVDLERLRRNLYASASCGICGKATLENALSSAPPCDDPARFARAFFVGLPDRLRTSQAAFDRTGGLHAAALVDPAGELVVVREDVGRHNAVDKVVGFAARAGRLPLAGHALLVSGRISYEIVQKALAARIPAVAAVSAPSSLAVELAEAARILLVGFLRGGSFNAYGARERLAG
ncbi:MAG TPA: formate dehydrogenase accessory sulfurtransferase FdhD [Myxococcota bacterium]|nr:formate dehydrogenase accessory sulfurtransferase FdhD [Myxococcota bacterium]